MPIVNNQTWNAHGDLIHDEWVDVPYEPLAGHQVIATLNAVLGLWTLTDAANAAGVTEEHLIAEALAWREIALSTSRMLGE
jgi:hypothetical protein